MTYLAIDIGGTFIKYALVEDNGKIIFKDKVPTPRQSMASFLSAIDGIVVKYQENIEGVALSIPAPVDNQSGLIKGDGSMPFLNGFSLSAYLEDKFKIKCSSENDGNCAALAEVWQGVAKGKKDVVLLVCGTGIGGAIVKDGKIHTGHHLFGGEIGYGIHNFDYDKMNFDTFSNVSSTFSMIKAYAAASGELIEDLNGEMIFERAENGDLIAQREIDKFFFGLAVGIHNVQYYYDPELIILGGAIASRHDFVEEIQKRFEPLYQAIAIAPFKPDIKKCAFQNDANLLGAVYHHFTLL